MTAKASPTSTPRKPARTVPAHPDRQALASTTAAGAPAGTAREVLRERVAAVRRSLEALRDAVVARTRQGVRAADDHVHAQPWKVLGAGVAAGVLVGWLLARRRQ